MVDFEFKLQQLILNLIHNVFKLNPILNGHNGFELNIILKWPTTISLPINSNRF